MAQVLLQIIVGAMASILLVEDDDNISQLLRFMFERDRHTVVAFADGQLALEHVRSHTPPDLVLLDSMLPRVDGPTLLKAMRALDAWRKTPVFMLTARSLERDVVTALDAGANDYIVKPFQPHELMARVRRQLLQVA